MPRKEYREWVSMFIKGIPLDEALLKLQGAPDEPEETQMILDQVRRVGFVRALQRQRDVGVNLGRATMHVVT